MPRKKPKYLKKEEGCAMKRIPVNHALVDWQGTYDVVDFWEDERLGCRACNKSFVFDAEMKREWYEIRGHGINVRPVYCAICFIRVLHLRTLAAGYETQKLEQMDRETLEQADACFGELTAMGDIINSALHRGVIKRLARLPQDD